MQNDFHNILLDLVLTAVEHTIEEWMGNIFVFHNQLISEALPTKWIFILFSFTYAQD